MQQSEMQEPEIPMDDDILEALNPNPQGLDENDPNVARDPVCKMLVDKRTAENTMAAPIGSSMEPVYFCSADCKAIFEQDPGQFGYTM